jgi:hypothetical protein
VITGNRFNIYKSACRIDLNFDHRRITSVTWSHPLLNWEVFFDVLMLVLCIYIIILRGARWSSTRKLNNDRRGQSLDGCPKFVYFELLRASEGTLSRWSRLHLQSLASTPVSRRVDVRQAAGCKNKCRIFITIWWKHIVLTPLSGISVGRRRL